MTTPGGADIAPDWETWQGEIHCPRCGYNLKMLSEPRCPECGLRSTWRELTERTIYEQNTGLFEYCWRRRPVRSLVSTIWRCMFPWLLWPRIPLVAEPRVGPLIMLVIIAALGSIALFIFERWCFAYISGFRPLGAYRYGWPEFRTTLWFGMIEGGMAALLMLLFGIMLLAAMMIFRQSMTRHRVRAIHVLRVAVLAWIGFLIWTSLLSLLTLFTASTPVLLNPTLEWFEWFICSGRDLPVFALLVLSLGLGWSVYLRVRWGWTNGVLATAVALVAMAVMMYHHAIYIARGLHNDVAYYCQALWPMFTQWSMWLMFGA